jgi:hypothetical protein
LCGCARSCQSVSTETYRFITAAALVTYGRGCAGNAKQGF